ncbi:MAG: hypothetical protein ACHRHE_12760 [Tepidisphaerales bacterium]
MSLARIIFSLALALGTPALAAAPPPPLAAYPRAMQEIVNSCRTDEETRGANDDVYIGIAGYGGREGSWLEDARSVLEAGKQEHFELLVAEKSPVLQAHGLYGLAHTATEKSQALLRARLDDQTPILLGLGCVARDSTLGNLAEELAFNRHRFEYRLPPEPALPADVLMERGLRVLADDKVVAQRASQRDGNPYPKYMHDLVEANSALLDLPRLRKLAPGLSDEQIIKAIGRFQESRPIMRFLIDCVADQQLARAARSRALRALGNLSYASESEALDALRKHRQQIWPDVHTPIVPPPVTRPSNEP